MKNNLAPQTSVMTANPEDKAVLQITYNVTDEQVRKSGSFDDFLGWNGTPAMNRRHCFPSELVINSISSWVKCWREWRGENMCFHVFQLFSVTSNAEKCQQYLAYACRMSRLLNTPGKVSWLWPLVFVITLFGGVWILFAPCRALCGRRQLFSKAWKIHMSRVEQKHIEARVTFLQNPQLIERSVRFWLITSLLFLANYTTKYWNIVQWTLLSLFFFFLVAHVSSKILVLPTFY